MMSRSREKYRNERWSPPLSPADRPLVHQLDERAQSYRVPGQAEHHIGALTGPVDHQVEVAVVEREHGDRGEVELCLALLLTCLSPHSTRTRLSSDEECLLVLVLVITEQTITWSYHGEDRPQQ